MTGGAFGTWWRIGSLQKEKEKKKNHVLNGSWRGCMDAFLIAFLRKSALIASCMDPQARTDSYAGRGE